MKSVNLFPLVIPTAPNIRVWGQSRGKLDGFDLSVDEGVAVAEAEGFDGVFAEDGCEAKELGAQVLGDFEQGREVALEQVPDRDGDLARARRRRLVAVFLHQQLPAPFVPGTLVLDQDVVRALDQQRAHVATAKIAYSTIVAVLSRIITDGSVSIRDHP